ncbi:MAG: RES family NAD+ phosphorylase [Flavobacterium sp.]
MKVFRIEREKYLDAALTGMGASLSKANRWNGLNTKMVYTSESRALATLEISVHLDLSEDLPSDRFYLEIHIPDTINILEINEKELPENWNAIPPTSLTQKIGNAFVTQNEAAVLKVPSSIVPNEFNYLINPFHPDATSVKITSFQKMDFDKRVWR